MSTELALDTVQEELNFEQMLEQALAETSLERGDIITGTILHIDNACLIVDVSWKHDGIVSKQDVERMGQQLSDFNVDDEIDVTVVRLDDLEGNLVLSASQARQNEDWKLAETLLESDETWDGKVAAANKGGLIVPFGNLRGFIPASHVVNLPRGLSEDDRIQQLDDLVGTDITVKVIEVNRKRRRLVFSQRNAEREYRNARKEVLLEQLSEGDTREGVVSGLCEFGAFVDMGGADGLIHISELAWHRVRHPNEVVNIGDQVKVYILHLDEAGKRIGLSLKRLQPNPWSLVEEMYHIGQLVEGTVSRVEPFGAFISLEPGIEALLHVSQISEQPIQDPRGELYEGQQLLTRVISIEADRQRLGLSLKEVTENEMDQWVARRAEIIEAAKAEAQAEAETDGGNDEAGEL